MITLDNTEKQFIKDNKGLLQKNDLVTFWDNVLEVSDDYFTSRISQYLQDSGINLLNYCNTKILNFLFYATNISDVKIPTRIKEIGIGTFSTCPRLKQIIIPPTVETIGGWAFEYCDNLEYIGFNEGLEKIEAYAFQDCLALNDVYLPESIKSVEQNAFDYCTSLNEFYIPKGVQKIGEYLFGVNLSVDLKVVCAVDKSKIDRVWPDWKRYEEFIEFI